MYRYFFKGYMEREHRIAEAAARIPDSRVVVLDLRRFYPSIDIPRLMQRFEGRIQRSGLSPSERETAIQCVEELTSIKHETGLPIGPPLSLALANVFLEDFDEVLSNEFECGYFRYVDDVALVVPRARVDSAVRFFERVAADEGLKVNRDKTDFLTGEERSSRVRHREQASEDSFGLLMSDLRRYLAHNTEDFDRVRGMFRDEGFSFPFSRLKSVAASSNAFRRFLNVVWSQSGGLFGQSIPRPPALLERARRLRKIVEERLRRITSESLPASGMARRWAIQDIRYLLNRSLYLGPVRRREEILGLLPDCSELRPSRAVLEALVTGVNLSAGYRPRRRTFDDFSYIDEIESLFLKPGIDIDRMLNSRFDDGEDVFLPTLSLGGGQSMT
jgi:hypothetical protein